jgi:hypothetical protein
MIPLAGYALQRALGGAISIAAATGRHGSADILKRLGAYQFPDGRSTLPQFYDPYHGCDMELLGFASDRVNPRFEDTVLEIQASFKSQLVISTVSPTREAAGAGVTAELLARQQPCPTQAA